MPQEKAPITTSHQEQVFSFDHLTSYQALAFLANFELDIHATVSDPNTLTLAGTRQSIHKAEVVFDLIDTSSSYVLESLGTAASVRTIPANDVIAEALGNTIAIGTFADPPQTDLKARGLIDLHRDQVIAIFPVERVPDLRRLIRRSIPRVIALETLNRSMSQAEPLAEATLSTPIELLTPIQEVNDPTPGPLPRRSIWLSSPDANQPVSGTLQIRPQAPEPNTVADEPSPRKGSEGHPVASVLDELALKDADDTIDLALPETLTLIQLLDLAGEYLGFDYLYEPDRIPNDTITLKMHGKLQGEVLVKDFYGLLEAILKFKGLALVRRDDQLVTVIPVNDVLEADPDIIGPDERTVTPGDFVVTRIFTLQHADVASAQKLLENMKLGVSVSVNEQTQTLFITCYAHRLKRIAQLISLIDQPGKARVLSFRRLKYTTASALTEQIQTLAENLEDGPVILLSSSAQSASGRSNRSQPPGSSNDAMLFLDIDARTNRIFIIGMEDHIELIHGLIDALDVPITPLMRMALYQMHHTDAQQVWQKLENVLSADGPIGASSRPNQRGNDRQAGRTGLSPQVVILDTVNALLVNATDQQHEQIQRILPYIDVAVPDRRILTAYPIRHIDALEVKARLQELDLFDSNAKAGGSSTPPQPNPNSARLTETVRRGPAIVVLGTINSLMIYATPEQHQRIEPVIAYMDSRPSEATIPYELYALQNQTPEHLAQILTRIIQETVINAEGQVEQIVRNTDEQIVIVPDEQTFSLIVYASRKNQEWISKLINKLDVRRPQVLIDVTLVEIRKTDEFNYDLNLIAGIPDLVETSGQIGSFTVDGQTVVETLQSIGRDRFTEFQTNSGVGTGFYGDSHINVLLSMMQSKDYGRILAKPKILVNDNETGVIKTTEMTYVTKKSSIPVSSGGAGQNTTLIETAIDYESYDAGIVMEITPHTSDGDLLRLDISLNRSDFGTITGEVPPDRASSELNTVVTVPDASTIILGGMLRLNQTKGGKKVPILGDLPILGTVFRSASNTDIQNKLYIFVRAEIIRPEETLLAAHGALQRTSQRNRQAFEAHEKEFQDYQILPDVNSPTIAPDKVLDLE